VRPTRGDASGPLRSRATSCELQQKKGGVVWEMSDSTVNGNRGRCMGKIKRGVNCELCLRSWNQLGSCSHEHTNEVLTVPGDQGNEKGGGGVSDPVDTVGVSKKGIWISSLDSLHAPLNSSRGIPERGGGSYYLKRAHCSRSTVLNSRQERPPGRCR